jgi:hypothetical protein
MKHMLLIIVILHSVTLIAQPQKTNYWKIGITTTEMGTPLVGLRYLFSSFNPGLEIGYLITHKAGKNYQLQFEPALSYTYHRWLGQTASLVGNEYFRYYLTNNFNLSARLGAGIEISEPSVYFETENSPINAHFLFNAAVGADQKISKRGVMIGVLYQFKPSNILAQDLLGMLPYNKMMVSMSFPITKK